MKWFVHATALTALMIGTVGCEPGMDSVQEERREVNEAQQDLERTKQEAANKVNEAARDKASDVRETQAEAKKEIQDARDQVNEEKAEAREAEARDRNNAINDLPSTSTTVPGGAAPTTTSTP